jgi:hypothetical protein
MTVRWRLLIPLLLLAVSAAGFAASTAVEEALTLMNQGKYDKALSRLDDHLDSAPQDAEARFTRGLVLVRLNRADDAIKAFTDLTRDYPQLPEPYNNLAVLYAQQGDYEKAREALEAALASHPSYVTAHENLGDIYAALANAAYSRALALEPGNAGVKAKLDLVARLESLADTGAAVAARVSLPKAKAEAAAAANAAPVAEKDAAAIRETIQNWAAAWSAKDADKYVALYAADFAPEGGGARQVWESQRRARIAKPKQIRVEVKDPQLTRLSDDIVRASFTQSYQSDLLSNSATKVLDLRNDGGQWKIVREYSK